MFPAHPRDWLDHDYLCFAITYLVAALFPPEFCPEARRRQSWCPAVSAKVDSQDLDLFLHPEIQAGFEERKTYGLDYVFELNLIENVNRRLDTHGRWVKRCVNLYQRYWWGAMAIGETEPDLRRIPRAEHLPKLAQSLGGTCDEGIY